MPRVATGERVDPVRSTWRAAPELDAQGSHRRAVDPVRSTWRGRIMLLTRAADRLDAQGDHRWAGGSGALCLAGRYLRRGPGPPTGSMFRVGTCGTPG
ncbi:hypothetical protein E4187_22010 (plasmid) [Aeromonas media]|uniref:hypothetical protein n=1 Tax=Aeromonas media TaxID=651 RepID=UPI00148B1DA6|nr:hypothetical protein [Aeromonas media]QJT36972.1 hypothetical protein E4187_22010 [Aeromonas media]